MPPLALAREIAEQSPDAHPRRQEAPERRVTAGVEDGMRLEEQLQRELIGSPNQLEAVQANMERRPPRFTDPS